VVTSQLSLKRLSEVIIRQLEDHGKAFTKDVLLSKLAHQLPKHFDATLRACKIFPADSQTFELLQTRLLGDYSLLKAQDAENVLSGSHGIFANKPYSFLLLSEVTPTNGSSLQGQENLLSLTPEQFAQRSIEIAKRKQYSR
jgi:hypothetical protein